MAYEIGAIQLEDIQGDIDAALQAIVQAMKLADAHDIDILCFPECFLQGYTLDNTETAQRALDLTSGEFKLLLRKLAAYQVTIILGLIEKDVGAYYNTAVVIRRGNLLGRYRKVHLLEKNFQPGEEYSVFDVDSLTFGINICYDGRFTEGSRELKEKGAKVIFYPLNNRLTVDRADKYRNKHLPNLSARAKESSCWVVSSDVIARDQETLSYGCTAIVSPEGKLVDTVTELTEGIVVHTINT